MGWRHRASCAGSLTSTHFDVRRFLFCRMTEDIRGAIVVGYETPIGGIRTICDMPGQGSATDRISGVTNSDQSNRGVSTFDRNDSLQQSVKVFKGVSRAVVRKKEDYAIIKRQPEASASTVLVAWLEHRGIDAVVDQILGVVA